MFLDVAERLLDDAVEVQFDVVREVLRQLGDGKINGHTSAFAKLGAQAAQGGGETEVVEFAGAEVARDATHFLDGFFEMRLGLEGITPGGGLFLDELFLDGLEAELHRRKDLDDAVVKI